MRLRTVKKNKVYFLFLLIVCIPAIAPLFKSGFFDANDAIWHIARFWQFHLSFATLQIPVRWAPNLFGGLGYPVFIVNYNLPYYLLEMIHIFGFGLVDTYKILLGLTFVISAFSMFLFLRSLFGNWEAFVGSIFFAYSPYRFATVYMRGAVGEALAIALVPLIFWSILQFERGTKKYGPILAIAILLVILSHPAVFLIFSPVILLISGIIFFKDLKKLIQILIWIGVGIIASSFQTLPAFFERKYLAFDEVYKPVYLGHFPNLFAVLRLPINNADLGTPLQIGTMHSFVLLLALVFIVFSVNKLNGRTIWTILCIVPSFFAFFLLSKASIFLWQKISLFTIILYPWRFINLMLFSSSVAAAFLTFKLKRAAIFGFILVFLTIFISRHWWGWTGEIPGSDSYYQNYQETTTAQGEFSPKGISQNIVKYSSPKVQMLDGVGQVLNETVRSNKWTFTTSADSEVLVKLGILNFPGWQIKVDGRKTQIIENYKKDGEDYSGLLLVKVPKGSHFIEATFSETRLRKVSDLISLVTFFLIILYFLPLRFENKKIKI